MTGKRRLEPGSKYVFYTEPVLFGETVGVRLVEAESDDRPAETIGEEVHRNLESDRLGERVREADLIVVGKVARVDTTRGREARIESEHLPDLRQASVSVSDVLKGELSGDDVAFLFAASRDIMWYQAPKFTVGTEGIFLLNKDAKGLEALGVSPATYTLLHRLDFQPPDKLDLIKSLLQ